MSALRGLVVICADNDHATEAKLGHNPGLDAAHEAAAILGCGVAVPEGMKGSDFCDLRNELVARRMAEDTKSREGDIRRAVNAHITGLIMKAARFLHP